MKVPVANGPRGPEKAAAGANRAAAGGAADSIITTAISLVLRIGVFLSAGIMAIGLAWYLLQTPNGPLGQIFQATRTDLLPNPIVGSISGTAQLQPQAIIALGVLVLLATPVIRVAASIALFLAEKDMLYTVITTIVLIILLLSIFKLG